jgi:hypothetical protein
VKASLGDDVDLDGRVAARVVDVASVNLGDSHFDSMGLLGVGFRLALLSREVIARSVCAGRGELKEKADEVKKTRAERSTASYMRGD